MVCSSLNYFLQKYYSDENHQVCPRYIKAFRIQDISKAIAEFGALECLLKKAKSDENKAYNLVENVICRIHLAL